MKIYIIRHGETEFNRLGIVQGSGVDTDLNDTGKEQAQAFFDYYADIDFDLIVTSKLKRTHQTVSGFIQKGIPWMQTPDINEIGWGEHEGQKSSPEKIVIYNRMIDAWKSGDYDASLPGGETARALNIRLNRFIEYLHTQPADQLLVCTHGRTIRSLITLLKGRPLSMMEETLHSNTGCYIVHLKDGTFEFEAENSTEHLNRVVSSQ
jgi:probable phosphoglycerate mutase